MAKNYSNITITTSSSDTYHTFEKSYSFDGIYRRIIGGDTLDTTTRGIIKTQSVNPINDEAFTFENDVIEYVRIRNLHATNALVFKIYNSESNIDPHFEIQGGEVIQFHSQLKFDNDDTQITETDYIAIEMQSGSGGADIFIGLSAA